MTDRNFLARLGAKMSRGRRGTSAREHITEHVPPKIGSIVEHRNGRRYRIARDGSYRRLN